VSIKYKLTSDERKAFVKAISEILESEATYSGTPAFAYEIGCCTVDKNGILTFSEDTATETSLMLVTALKERGYEPEVTDDVVTTENHVVVVEVSREGFSDEALENLRKIIASKSALFKKALGTDNDLPFNKDAQSGDADYLSFDVIEDKLCFPWFTVTGADGETDAYTRFILALCEMAKKQKRVTAKEHDIENEKFAMRVFLIRLGFIGDEYKTARKILLRNLTGNSSWKSGQSPKKVTIEPDSAGETCPGESENMEEVVHYENQ